MRPVRGHLRSLRTLGAASIAIAFGGCGARAEEPSTDFLEAAAPIAMVSDNTHLFILDAASARVSRIATSGGDSFALADGFRSLQPFIGQDSTSVYFLGDEIFAVAKGGGARTSVSSRRGTITGAAVASGFVYWADADGGGITTIKGSPMGGGPAVTVATHNLPISRMVAMSHLLLVSDPGVRALSLADPLPGKLHPVPGAGLCRRLLADATAAYCVPVVGSIVSIADDESTRVIGSVTNADGAALDRTDLYVTSTLTDGGAAILRIPRSGGEPVVFAREAASVIAVDDHAVYWTTGSGIRHREK